MVQSKAAKAAARKKRHKAAAAKAAKAQLSVDEEIEDGPLDAFGSELVGRKMAACLSRLSSTAMAWRLRLSLVSKAFGRLLGPASIHRLELVWEETGLERYETRLIGWQKRLKNIRSLCLVGPNLLAAQRLLACSMPYTSLRSLRIRAPLATKPWREGQLAPYYPHLCILRLSRGPPEQAEEAFLWRWLLRALPNPASLARIHFGGDGGPWLPDELDMLQPSLARFRCLRHLTAELPRTMRQLALSEPLLTASAHFDETESAPPPGMERVQRLSITAPWAAQPQFVDEDGGRLLPARLARVRVHAEICQQRQSRFRLKFWTRLAEALPHLTCLRLDLTDARTTDQIPRGKSAELYQCLDGLASLQQLQIRLEGARFLSLIFKQAPLRLILLDFAGGTSLVQVSERTAASLDEVRWSASARRSSLWKLRLNGKAAALPKEPLHGFRRLCFSSS